MQDDRQPPTPARPAGPARPRPADPPIVAVLGPEPANLWAALAPPGGGDPVPEDLDTPHLDPAAWGAVLTRLRAAAGPSGDDPGPRPGPRPAPRPAARPGVSPGARPGAPLGARPAARSAAPPAARSAAPPAPSVLPPGGLPSRLAGRAAPAAGAVALTDPRSLPGAAVAGTVVTRPDPPAPAVAPAAADLAARTLDLPGLVADPDPAPPARGRRALVLLAGVLVTLAGAGLGLAALTGGTDRALPRPALPRPSLPAGGVPVGAGPAATTAPAPPAAAGAPSSSRPGPGAAAAAPGGTGGPPAGTGAPGPGAPGSAAPTSAGPGGPGGPGGPVLRRPLTATLVTVADAGAGRHRGTVRIANPGGRDTEGWVLTLRLPAVQDPASDDVALRREGDTVIFLPYREVRRVPANGSVTFTFTVDGPLNTPQRCTVNGHACAYPQPR